MNADRSSTPDVSGTTSQPTEWETAYLRFETPEQEVRKFRNRLLRLGSSRWPRDAKVVELFCGRGSGLLALRSLGFEDIEGIDLSPALAAAYQGPGQILIGDCRSLPFPDASRDILIVQGGLHHLADLPGDLNQTLAEVVRVLRVNGRFVVVEPWLTPFLRAVHLVCDVSLARRVSNKIDALASMIEHEKVTYHRWLNTPDVILASLAGNFDVEHCKRRVGKLTFVGRRR